MKRGGVKTVVHGKEASRVSLLTISAVDTVLNNKSKADELSKEAAKHRARNSKRQQMPNTTQGEDGIVVRKKLCRFNKEKEKNRTSQIK